MFNNINQATLALQTKGQKEKQSKRKTGRQRDRQTYRQTDRRIKKCLNCSKNTEAAEKSFFSRLR